MSRISVILTMFSKDTKAIENGNDDMKRVEREVFGDEKDGSWK